MGNETRHSSYYSTARWNQGQWHARSAKTFPPVLTLLPHGKWWKERNGGEGTKSCAKTRGYKFKRGMHSGCSLLTRKPLAVWLACAATVRQLFGCCFTGVRQLCRWDVLSPSDIVTRKKKKKYKQKLTYSLWISHLNTFSKTNTKNMNTGHVLAPNDIGVVPLMRFSLFGHGLEWWVCSLKMAVTSLPMDLIGTDISVVVSVRKCPGN